ncbi:MAG: S8 family serine peptidase, partial [Polyangiaceae bacterium]|nr:S8 family serine peptidase [Polyangiaceae bacterium]
GRVPVTVVLPPGESAERHGMFEVAPGIGSIRLSPLDLETFAANEPDLQLFVGPGTRPQLDKVNTWLGTADLRAGLPPGTGFGRGVVVGVIDTGIDVTHPAFRNEDGTTRIRWLMTWGDPQGLHPELEAAYGCTDLSQAPCAIYAAEDINAMLSNERPVPDDAHDFAGHGTHVSGIAAGNGAPSGKEKRKFIGIAPEATLIVASPSPGGGFGDDLVLRSARFVFDRADELGMPAVANFSLGGDFGPHDGTSPLEQGLASFVGDGFPGRAVIVAAGNSGSIVNLGDVAPNASIHTEASVSEHSPVRIPIVTPLSTSGDVFVWVTYRKDDDIRVGLEGPDGVWISPVERGEDVGYDDGAGTTGAVVNDKPGSASMTDDSDGAVVVWSGTWPENGEFAILLEGSGKAQLWVSPQGEAGDHGVFFKQGLREGTVNSPATHPRLLGVGCTLNRISWTPLGSLPIEISSFGVDEPPFEDSLCFFSAGGPTPTGVAKPEILAPGAFVGSAVSNDADPRTHPGSMFDSPSCEDGEACYLVGDRYGLALGTSMSTPVVSGAAALLFEQNPSLTQAMLTEILQASARYPQGNIDAPALMGAGAIDLRQAMKVLTDDSGTIGADPDVGQSWWVLGASNARPDPSWLVEGTIQLRLADATVASGLDGTKLRIEVENGVLARSVLKKRHGLFSFAVAGLAGTGGTEMTVRVLYNGEQIGEEVVLPVGVDAWATGPFTADGGCDCRTAGGSNGREHAALSLFAIGAALTVLRRRRPSRPRA